MAIALACSASLAAVLALSPYVPATRDGIDSANFILAVDQYAPAQHQPHPPGYPIHVAIGRQVANVYRAATSSAAGEEIPTAAAALRLWSLFCGLLVVSGIGHLAQALGASARCAWLTAALFASCPLFLITTVRPLSDAPGLLFVLAAQLPVLWAGHWNDRAAATAGGWPWRLYAGAALAGMAMGVRVQTGLLTVPLLVVTVLARPTWRSVPVLARVMMALTAGVAVWAIPMLAVVGVDEYWRLVGEVANDDVQGVEMLATQPSARMLYRAVVNTFVEPWRWGWLAVIAAGLALRGAYVLAWREPSRFLQIATLAAPYVAWHLAFQETASVRYALPIVASQVLLMAAGAARSRVATAAAGIVIVAGGVTSVTAVSAYWRAASPVEQSMQDLELRASTMTTPPALAFHHAVVRAARGNGWIGRTLDAPVRYEWLEVAEHFSSGRPGPVWFLADRRRTDLALFDPHDRRLVQGYGWPAAVAPLLGGIQPRHVLWHEIRDPGWMLLRGWSLTAETHGVSRRDGHTPGGLGTDGRIRRRTTAAVMMIGGRNLGGPCDTGALVDVSIDGRVVAQWTAGPHAAFLQVVPLAAGALEGPGAYAALRVTARDAAGTARLVDVAIHSFDVQSPGTPMASLGAGWHVPELDDRTGEQWRWMDEVGELQVEGFGADVELTLRGSAAPVGSGAPPHVEFRAGDVVIGSFPLASAFEWTVRLPAAALATSGGRVEARSRHWVIPDELRGNGDKRRLSLQLSELTSRLAS